MSNERTKVLPAIDAEDKAGGEHAPIQPSLRGTPVSRRACGACEPSYQALQCLTSPERVLKMVMHHVGGRNGASTVSHYDTPVA